MMPPAAHEPDGFAGSRSSGTEISCTSRNPPPPLRFTSYSLLEGGDTATGSLGLPTGALFTPFSQIQPAPPRIPRQPVLCTFCSAYPSPFCKVDPETGGWRCCFCKGDNPCYAEDFIGSTTSEHRDTFPEMAYKTVEYAEQDLAGVLSGMSALHLATGPHRTRDRAAAAPAHVFVVDGNMRGEALTDLARSVDKVLGTMEPEALVSLVVFTGVVSVYRLGRAGVAVADVFPGDETLADEEVDSRLAEGEKDHFLPVRAGREALCTILELLRGIGDGPGSRGQAGGNINSRGGTSHGDVHGVGREGESGRRQGGSRGGRRRAWGARRVPVPAHRRRRCLGAAVEYALRLARTAERPSARLLVCLGGCPNYGPGAVTPCIPGAASAEVEPEALAAATDYFEDLGDRALAQGTGVDVFCGGSEALGAPALQGLVAPTGGYVLIQPSFAEGFAINLGRSISEQSMSDGDGLHGCIIDVRASSGMDLLHVIGPAESTEDYDDVDREAESASMAAAQTAEVTVLGSQKSAVVGSEDGGNNSRHKIGSGNGGVGRSYHRLVTGRVDPRTSLALYFDGPPKKTKAQKIAARKRAAAAAAAAQSNRDGKVGEEEEEEDHVVFQMVTRRSSPGGDGRITRVLTHRLPVTSNHHGFLQTVDPEAVAVLIGKEAVLRATFGTDSGTNQHEVEEARVTVDTVVQEISSRFRDLQKRNTARNNSSSGGGGDAPVTANSRGKGNAGTTPHDGRQTRHNETGDVRSRERDGGSLSLMDAEGGTAGYQSGVDGESEALLAPGADDVRIGNVGHPAGEADEDYGPEDLVFPRELGQLPRQLFHLRRGPLLGPLLQNADDPLCLRHLFLRGALEECLRLMAPAMLSLKATEAMSFLAKEEKQDALPAAIIAAAVTAVEKAAAAAAAGDNDGVGSGDKAFSLALPFVPVPVETLAMLADRILILDTHDRIFVWSGAAVCGPEFDCVRKACEGIFAGEGVARYPSAPVVFLKDGTSWSRYLTSRLIPSHKDPVEEQLRGFPELAGVSPAEVERLRAKLPPTDDESYREFFWDVCDGDGGVTSALW